MADSKDTLAAAKQLQQAKAKKETALKAAVRNGLKGGRYTLSAKGELEKVAPAAATQTQTKE